MQVEEFRGLSEIAFGLLDSFLDQVFLQRQDSIVVAGRCAS